MYDTLEAHFVSIVLILNIICITEAALDDDDDRNRLTDSALIKILHCT